MFGTYAMFPTILTRDTTSAFVLTVRNRTIRGIDASAHGNMPPQGSRRGGITEKKKATGEGAFGNSRKRPTPVA